MNYIYIGIGIFVVVLILRAISVRRVGRPSGPVRTNRRLKKMMAVPKEQLLKDVHELASGGYKIEAIKKYRDATGAGLKEAKEYVERLENKS